MKKQIDRTGIEINHNAPLVASCETVIHAEIDEVWVLLSDINRWPMWVSSVSDSIINGDLEPGTTVIWKKNRLKINSTIIEVVPNSRLTWKGKLFGIRAVHTWHLEQLDDNKTLVTTSESMEGLLAKWFLRTSQLEKILSEWLSDLKTAAES
jgi:hypothetical protein